MQDKFLSLFKNSAKNHLEFKHEWYIAEVQRSKLLAGLGF
jgi:hypothetical protein